MTAPAATSPVEGTSNTPILLYDGTCGLCARSVQFVLQHEHESKALRFATLQGEVGAAAIRANPAIAGVDSVIWVEQTPDGRPTRVLIRSDAVLAVMQHLGGIWRALGVVGRIIPRTMRDAAYRLVARNRYRVFGRDQSCLLPSAEERARFLS